MDKQIQKFYENFGNSIFFLLPSLFLLTQCTPYSSQSSTTKAPPVQTVNTSEVTGFIQDVCVEFKHKRHLHLTHASTCFDEGLQQVRLEFDSQDILELEEARMLIVDLIQALVNSINRNPVIVPNLGEIPFTADGLEIYISFESFFGKYIDPYYVTWISVEDGVIRYYTFDTMDTTKNCWHVKRESIATSSEIVTQQRMAEQHYLEKYPNKKNIFGTQRYYPPQ